jgi:hypothetical protein
MIGPKLPFIFGTGSAASRQPQNAAVTTLYKSTETSSRSLLIFLIPGAGFPEQIRSESG